MSVVSVNSVEMELPSALLDPDDFEILDPDGYTIDVMSGWVDVTSDVRTQIPITYTSGNPNNDIEARVADEGVLTLALDNSENNSAGLLGYYSPDNLNCRDYFGQGTFVRVKCVYDGVTYYQWVGKINTIQPSSGSSGNRLTIIEALDYMHELYEADFINVNVQENKRDDELLTMLLANVARQPFDTDFDTGSDQYTYAFQDEVEGTSKIVSVIQKMMMSGLGKVFVRGGTTSPEVLTYINRQNVLSPGAAVAALDENMVGLEVVRDEYSLVKKVNVTTYPVEIDALDVVLWQLNSQITLDAGTSKTFTMYLRDPNGRATKIVKKSLVDPVADTDYKFSSVSGSGNDLNADIDIAFSDGTNAIEVTVTNNAATTGYLWFFQPRGKGVYLYEPVTVSETTGHAQGRTENIDMVYQEDVNVGRDVATITALWYETPRSNIKEVKFIANSSEALMEAAMVVQPGDYVTIKETVTGIDTGFNVNGVDKQISAEDILTVTWYLCQAQIVTGFTLDVDLLDVGVLGV